jgi:prophage antirepressor-like protein
MNSEDDSTSVSVFGEQPVSIIRHDGDWWMTSQQIGEALEYAEPRDSVLKIYERNRDELGDFSVTVRLTATDGKSYETRVFNEEGVMLVCILSGQPRAKAFRRWAVSVLKQHRHGEFDKLRADNARLRNALGMWRNAGAAMCQCYHSDFTMNRQDFEAAKQSAINNKERKREYRKARLERQNAVKP